MPTTKSAAKDLRKSQRAATKNSREKAKASKLVKLSRKSIEANDLTTAQDHIAKTVKALDKAAQHGVLKKRTVARKKSRLMRRLHAAKRATTATPSAS